MCVWCRIQSDNGHMSKIFVNTSTEYKFYRDNKIQLFFCRRDTDFVTWKPTQFLKARDQLTNPLVICLLTLERSQWTWNITVMHTIADTAFTQIVLLLLFFIYLAEVLHRYGLGGASDVGMCRRRKVLLDCPLFQHSSPGPKWTICMLFHSVQGIQINLFTWQFYLYRPITALKKYIAHTHTRSNF